VSFLLAGWAFEIAFIKLMLVVKSTNTVIAKVMPTDKLIRNELWIDYTVILAADTALGYNLAKHRLSRLDGNLLILMKLKLIEKYL